MLTDEQVQELRERLICIRDNNGYLTENAPSMPMYTNALGRYDMCVRVLTMLDELEQRTP